MLYRAHVKVGLAGGVAVASLAFLTESVRSNEALAAMCLLCVVFSLVPDLDTASVAQRWFYRGMLVVLVYLMAQGHTEQAAFAGAVAMLPLVHRHRGWMHAWWAAPVVPLGIVALWEAYRRSLSWFSGFGSPTPVELVAELLQDYGPFYLAMVTGYLLHLAVDRLPRMPRGARLS